VDLSEVPPRDAGIGAGAVVAGGIRDLRFEI
jgi:hypothetical protein